MSMPRELCRWENHLNNKLGEEIYPHHIVCEGKSCGNSVVCLMFDVLGNQLCRVSDFGGVNVTISFNFVSCILTSNEKKTNSLLFLLNTPFYLQPRLNSVIESRFNTFKI